MHLGKHSLSAKQPVWMQSSTFSRHLGNLPLSAFQLESDVLCTLDQGKVSNLLSPGGWHLLSCCCLLAWFNCCRRSSYSHRNFLPLLPSLLPRLVLTLARPADVLSWSPLASSVRLLYPLLPFVAVLVFLSSRSLSRLSVRHFGVCPPSSLSFLPFFSSLSRSLPSLHLFLSLFHSRSLLSPPARVFHLFVSFVATSNSFSFVLF